MLPHPQIFIKLFNSSSLIIIRGEAHYSKSWRLPFFHTVLKSNTIINKWNGADIFNEITNNFIYVKSQLVYVTDLLIIGKWREPPMVMQKCLMKVTFCACKNLNDHFNYN